MASLMEALQTRLRIARDWQSFLDDYPLLLCPVSAELPFADQLDVESPESLQRVVTAQLTQIALPLIGVPAMSVCTGALADVPLGVQLVGPRFREDIVLDAAADIEARCPPVTVAESA